MNDTIKAGLWMIGAIFSFSSMAIAGRALSDVHDTFEMMLFRSLVGIVIVVTVAKATGRLHQINRDRLGLHLLRNFFHFIGQNLWFYALPLIPLATLFALEFTTPIWVMILGAIVLGERLTGPRVAATLIGFAGILMITRPNPETISVGLVVAALSAVAFAGSFMTTKILTRTVSTTCILFWLTVMQAVMGVIMAGYDLHVTWPTRATLPWLTLIGCAGLLAHFCITSALRLAPATVVIPFDFVRLPAIAVIGMVFYAEPLDLWTMVGAVVIFAGIYINVLSESRVKGAGTGS